MLAAALPALVLVLYAVVVVIVMVVVTVVRAEDAEDFDAAAGVTNVVLVMVEGMSSSAVVVLPLFSGW